MDSSTSIPSPHKGRPHRMSWESGSTFDYSETRRMDDAKHSHLENVYSAELERQYGGHHEYELPGTATPYESHSVPLDPKLPEDSIPLRERHDSRAYSLVAAPQRSRFTFIFKKPYFVWLLSAVQIGMFIGELVRNFTLTGSPIQTSPSVNVLIGPTSYTLINMGARFPPCMHTIQNITNSPTLTFPCPNSTTTTSGCTLSELCGFNSFPPNGTPNQWWRFIVPIFLHGGFLHILFNLMVQLGLGADMEKEVGILPFGIIYFASGIFGFVLGGNYAPDGIASTGCSGSLFGIIALVVLDLFYYWNERRNPVREMVVLGVQIGISFVLGLLPGLDNFSHIGGFFTGLLLGVALLPSPQKLMLSRRVWMVVRVCTGVGFVVLLAVFTSNFYTGGGKCSWCKYLSCLPIRDWCSIGGITTTSQQ